MDAELKRSWIDALRSGEYKQARQALRHKDAYCFLGVLCDLIDPEGWTHDGDYDLWHHGNEEEYLPGPVRAVAGLDTSAETDLAEMNDNGASFADIADRIETTVEAEDA